jgi:putative DNA primase/helicase
VVTVEDEPSALDLLNDTGNAERMRRRYEGRLLHCWPWKKGLTWDGRRWRVDDSGRAEKAARVAIKRDFQETTREVMALKENLEAAGEDDDQAGQVSARLAMLQKRTKFLLASMDRKRIDAMLAFARSELPVLPDRLNRHPHLLNCRNGTLDLQTGVLRPHRREDYLTTLCPYDYRPDAPRRVFDVFLETVLPGGRLRLFVQQLFGLGLVGRVHEHVLPILYGAGRNGKATLVEAVCAALGRDYADAIAPELRLARRNESHPTEVADLYGRRVVIASETKEGKWLNAAAVKRLTGGDKLKARRMREDFWSFDPSHTIFLLTNNKPRVEGQEIAIWSRLKLVPFAATFYKPNELPPGTDAKFLADPRMPDKLAAEAEGILAWAVEGGLDWNRHGLVVPDEVEKATGQYREESDVVRRFLDECTRRMPGAEVRAGEVYSRFTAWLKASGDEAHISLSEFGARVELLGIIKKKSNGVKYRAIVLSAPDDE